MSTKDVFPGIAGGAGDGRSSGKNADALRAEKAPKGEEGTVQSVNPMTDGTVGLEVEGGATEVA